MRRLESVLLMPKNRMQREGFTLVEVMVSVVIISLVIMAIFSMKSNNTFLLQKSQMQKSIQGYQTLFLATTEHGFTKEELSLDKLVGKFDLDDALRRTLKEQKIQVNYETLNTLGEDDTTFFELGKTTLKTPQASSSFVRLRGL